MGKLSEFIAYLEEQAANHSIYVWGGQGQDHTTISEAWIQKMEDSEANARRAIAFWKKQVKAGYGEKLRAFDCGGLATYYLYDVKKATGCSGYTAAVKPITSDISWMRV